MNVDDVVAGLDSVSERNHTLSFLESLVVDIDGRLVRSIIDVIRDPSSVDNTNRFASLLKSLGSEAFIPPLIEVISTGSPETSRWLADYMYALGGLLDEQDDFWPAEEDFVHLLGDWLLSTGGGEISWKAGIILAAVKHPSSRPYLLRGVADQSLFHQTRIDCLRAFVNMYGEDAQMILEQLSTDPQKIDRDAALKQTEWIIRRALIRDSQEGS